jgi:hypothetical protein
MKPKKAAAAGVSTSARRTEAEWRTSMTCVLWGGMKMTRTGVELLLAGKARENETERAIDVDPLLETPLLFLERTPTLQIRKLGVAT